MIKDSCHHCCRLLRQSKIHFVPITILWIHGIKLRHTSIACISLLWRTSEEVEGPPGCADRPQDQRRRQNAMVGTRGCRAATPSNQKKRNLATIIFLLDLKITRESMSERVYEACDELTDAPEWILTNIDLNGLGVSTWKQNISWWIKSSPAREVQAPKPGQAQ